MKNQALFLVLFAVILGSATSAQAARICPPEGQGLEEIIDETINEKLKVRSPVPPDETLTTCNLSGVAVVGDVVVESGAKLEAVDRTVVVGDLMVRSSDQASSVEGGTATVEGATIYGDVVVKADGELRLIHDGFDGYRTLVTGDVFINSRAEVDVQGIDPNDPTTIEGSILADGADKVFIDGWDSDGVVIKNDLVLRNNSGNSGCQRRATIMGNLLAWKNDGSLFFIDCVVQRNMLVYKNKYVGEPPFGPAIDGNTIYGDLNCRDNDPLPTLTVRNAVTGEAKNECEGFD